MTQFDTSPSSQSVEVLKRFNISLLRSISLLRWVGRVFLILFVFDLIDILYPLNLMNPAWEFQTMGQLVERMAVPLLGLVLVFFGERHARERWEIPLLKVLSWIALLYGLFLFLLVPLGAVNTFRLNQQSSQQVANQVNQTKAQIQLLKQELEAVNTPADLEVLLSQINRQGGTPTIQNSEQFAEIKQQLATFVSTGEQELQSQAEETRSTQRMNLLERSLKWNLGALISGGLLISLWRGTAWARQRW